MPFSLAVLFQDTVQPPCTTSQGSGTLRALVPSSVTGPAFLTMVDSGRVEARRDLRGCPAEPPLSTDGELSFRKERGLSEVLRGSVAPA